MVLPKTTEENGIPQYFSTVRESRSWLVVVHDWQELVPVELVLVELVPVEVQLQRWLVAADCDVSRASSWLQLRPVSFSFLLLSLLVPTLDRN